MHAAQGVDSSEMLIDWLSGDKCPVKQRFVFPNLASGMLSARYLALGEEQLQFRAPLRDNKNISLYVRWRNFMFEKEHVELSHWTSWCHSTHGDHEEIYLE